jgi:hypothetical protein
MSGAPGQIIVNPATGRPVTAGQALAAWLERYEPALFQALAARANVAPSTGALGDLTDFLSSAGSDFSSIASDIGSGISSAASSVGDWLTTGGGTQALANLATTYVQTQQAQALTNLQIQRAQAGLAPAPVAVAQSAAGTPVPVYTSIAAPPPAGAQLVTLANGQQAYALTGSQVSSLASPTNWSSYLPWALGAGALLLLALK